MHLYSHEFTGARNGLYFVKMLCAEFDMCRLKTTSSAAASDTRPKPPSSRRGDKVRPRGRRPRLPLSVHYDRSTRRVQFFGGKTAESTDRMPFLSRGVFAAVHLQDGVENQTAECRRRSVSFCRHSTRLVSPSAAALFVCGQQGIIYPCSPPKTFLTPLTPSATGCVKSSYTYPDTVYAVLSYRRLPQ